MLRWKHCCRFALLMGLLAASGCQLFPSLGGTRRNSYGVPIQSEPDLSQFEDEFEE